MRCAECGHQTPETSAGRVAVHVLGDAGWREFVPAQQCERCFAPISRQRSVRAAPPGLGDAVTTSRPTGQRAGGRVFAGVLAGVTLVAVVVATIVAVGTPTAASERQLTRDQLRPGDCLTGSNMGLDTSSRWPHLVAAVPCSQQHLAEVFFAGNAWPQSLTAYPGTNTISIQAWNRCLQAFVAYDGIANDGILNAAVSSFRFDFIGPAGASDWRSGDRRLVCVAHKGTTLVNYSIKGSRR